MKNVHENKKDDLKNGTNNYNTAIYIWKSTKLNKLITCYGVITNINNNKQLRSFSLNSLRLMVSLQI